MRGIQTPVRNVRRRIFKEIAKFGYEQRNLQDLEDLPYEIIPGEVAKYRDSIYRERAIVGERLRLAMGMSLNPADKPTRITKGIDESNISEKYYEPPLLQVIPSACNECKEKAFIVGEQLPGMHGTSRVWKFARRKQLVLKMDILISTRKMHQMWTM